MHELSVVTGIIRHINAQKRRYNFSRVNAVEIVCGKYNCLSEDTLQFYFEAVKMPLVEKTHLTVKRMSKDSKCIDCGAEFDGRDKCGRCICCGSSLVISGGGNGIYISKLEVE